MSNSQTNAKNRRTYAEFVFDIVVKHVKQNRGIVMVMASELTKAVERFVSAKPSLRSAMHASAVGMATNLANERDALMTLLEGRWKWLDDHPEHPSYIEREDEVLADLKRYEQIEDALRHAASALFGGSA